MQGKVITQSFAGKSAQLSEDAEISHAAPPFHKFLVGDKIIPRRRRCDSPKREMNKNCLKITARTRL